MISRILKIATIILLSSLALPCSYAVDKTKIVFVAGRDSHGPNSHEHKRGTALLAGCLELAMPELDIVTVHDDGWPKNETVLKGADSVIFYCDGGHGHVMNDHLKTFDGLLDDKVGIVCMHYGVEVPKGSESSKRMLNAIGGYFETNYSVNPTWIAEFNQFPEHPITRGVTAFGIRDEWYFNMRFQPDMKGVTPILSAVPPPSTMKRKDGPHSGNPTVREMVKNKEKQHLAWAYERPNGGRGFGFTGGHFHDNWNHDRFRKVVLNAIVWTAGVEVPEKGIESQVHAGSIVKKYEKNEVPVDMFHLNEDLEITLWAQTPLFYNPTNMDVDAEGRMWIAEGRNYRGHMMDKKGDRIVVVSDSDSDGKADKSHVFVQDKELVAPLGIAVIDNQIIVSDPPHLIVYTDVDRDLKFNPEVDKRENLLSGFSGKNHDHSLHSLTIGPDGKYYFNFGNAGTGKITDKSGRTFRIGSFYSDGELAGKKSDDGHVYIGGTVLRMNPDGTMLEPVGHNFRNSYEQVISSFGDLYNNDNDEPPNCRTSWIMEYGNSGYASVENGSHWARERRPGQKSQVAHWRQEDPGVIPAGDVYGVGSPTGIAFYENGALPEKYIGTLLSCEAAQNVIFGYNPKSQGAGINLEDNRYDFITTNKEKKFEGVDSKAKNDSSNLKSLFRPSDIVIGPDGALYVADWFDSRVGGHSTTDFDGLGNIYRIAPRGFKPGIPTIDYNSIDGLVEALKSPAVNVRGHAFLKLQEKGAEALDPVLALLDDANPYIRARAVWLLPYLGDGGLEKAESLLDANDVNLRITAYRALRRVNKHFKYANELASDKSAAVRREVAISMRDESLERSKDILLDIAKKYDGSDRWYLEAFGIGASGKEAELYDALFSQIGSEPAKWDDRFSGIAWRLHPESATAAFRERAASAKLNFEDRKKMLTALAFTPGDKGVDAMIEISNLKDRGNDREIIKLAKWWLSHPHYDAWKKHPQLKELFEPVKIDKDYITPKSFGVKTNLPSIEKILTMEGSVERGAMHIGRCVMCHNVGEAMGGADFGPNIASFGKTQSREVILKTLVDPSNDIAHGFETYEAKLKNGKRVEGIEVGVTSDTVTLKVFGGQNLTMARNDIKSYKKLKRSMMVSAANMGLSAQDVRDIVEYMKAGDELGMK